MQFYSLSPAQREVYRRFANIALPRHTSYPTVPVWQETYGPEQFRDDLQQAGRQRRPASLYVHVPFCERLCYYCACTREIVPAERRAAQDPGEAFLAGLAREVQLLAELSHGTLFEQVHLGGGSPTFLRVDQLQRLWRILQQHFDITPRAEIAIEIDPRITRFEQLLALRNLGFNRVSLGIQDFAPAVQRAVNREQALDLVERVVGWCRALGFSSINFDLIYGLPFQTLDSMADTLDQTIVLAPDRVAFYRLAVIPEIFRWQNVFHPADLPGADLCLDLNLLAINRFREAGYEFIGLDHFARPDEPLAQARHNASLRRTFQGMTTGKELDILALGPSGISQLDGAYAQNQKTSALWQEALVRDLATERGLRLTDDDRLRRELLQQLYGHGLIGKRVLEERFEIVFDEYFAEERTRLRELIDLGLVLPESDTIQLTAPLGRLLVRTVAAVFDRYLPPQAFREGLPTAQASKVGWSGEPDPGAHRERIIGEEDRMSPKEFQIDPQTLAAVVPDCYAEFRPIVAAGLTFFLRQLSPARFAEIFEAQAKLPPDTDLERRLVVFLHACPVLHKIGQVLARHRRLDPELRRHLQELETLEPHTPLEQLRPALDRELGPAAEHYRIRVEDRALAEGSVAVVLPLTWSDPADGPHAPRQAGVAKVLKPGILERVDEDLLILGLLAGYLEDRMHASHLPTLAYREIFHEVAQLLVHEVRLGQEQKHLALAAEQYAGQGDVHIPELLPFGTPGLTAMARVSGRKPTDPRAVEVWRRPALFRRTVRALLSSVLLRPEAPALFHGDPHAGNLLVDEDGRLVLLDWSLAGQLTSADRRSLSEILVGGWTKDAGRVRQAVAGLARGRAREDVLRDQVDAALSRPRWRRGPLWAVGLLDALARAGVSFPARWMLFRKSFLTLEGVLADLWPGGSLDMALLTDAVVQLSWEWPLRWCKPLHDCDYGTHLSSADLVRLLLAPLAAA